MSSKYCKVVLHEFTPTFEFKLSEWRCRLGRCAVKSGRSLPTFQRCLLPPSSGPDYTAQHHRRQSSSLSPSWETEMSVKLSGLHFCKKQCSQFRGLPFVWKAVGARPVLTTGGVWTHGLDTSRQCAPLRGSLHQTEPLRSWLHAVKWLLAAAVHAVSRSLLNTAWVDARWVGVARPLESASPRELRLVSHMDTVQPIMQDGFFLWLLLYMHTCRTGEPF
jgi:hypothetical protein